MELKRQAAKFQTWLEDVHYKDWGFEVKEKWSCLYLQVQFLAPDNDSDSEKMSIQKGRKWLLSEHMTKSELVQTALKAILTAEEHEIRERFTYKGAPIFGPHLDVDELWKFTASGDRTDIRTNHSKTKTNAKD